MFGLSFGELLIIAVLALLLLGPERLPEAAKTFGKGLRELRRVTDDLRDQVEHEIYPEERRPSLVSRAAAAPGADPTAPPPAATAENVPGLEAALAEPARAAPPVAGASGDAPPAVPDEKR